MSFSCGVDDDKAEIYSRSGSSKRWLVPRELFLEVKLNQLYDL